MGIVATDVPMTYDVCERTVRELAKTYPEMKTQMLTETAFGRKVLALELGRGRRRVLYTAAHHANEWITAPVLLKIFEAEKIFGEHSANPGDISTDGKTFFRIASSDGWVDVRSMQLAGKKRMSVEDFLRGYRHGAGTVVR